MSETFQVKDFLSIVASMVNYMRAAQKDVTDFNVGSVARSMLEAPAAEIDQLYQRTLAGLRQAIPVAVFSSFDFPALPAQKATGLVRYTIAVSDQNIAIPANTRFVRSDSGAAYFSIEDQTIEAGQTFIDIRVAAETPGIAGNLFSGTTFTPSPAADGFISAVALGDFRNGADAETEAQHKSRFNGFISSLSRGTIAALAYGLTLVNQTDSAGNIIERVVHANIVEPYLADPNEPIAYVEIYIHNGVGQTTTNLVNRALEVLTGYIRADGTPVPGWKAAGVKILVQSATEVPVNVGGLLEYVPGFDPATVKAAVQAAQAGYLRDLGIGKTVLRAELIALAMGVDGVENFTLTFPAADVPIDPNDKPMPGIFTLTSEAQILRPQGMPQGNAFGSPTVVQ